MEELIAGYSEPQRFYHGLKHLTECIAVLEPLLPLCRFPGAVELALWFHDARYDPRAGDNERQSANWAVAALRPFRIPSATVHLIEKLIMATRHASPPQSEDEQLLVDVDLAIFGAPKNRFDEYEGQIRREYAWVEEKQFRQKRRALLQGFLARERIYGTESLHKALEAAARENIASAIAKLED